MAKREAGDPLAGGNAGHGHGNTYRLTVMGTYSFTPNFLVDAHYGWSRQGTASEQPGLGPNVGWTSSESREPMGPARSRAAGPSFSGTARTTSRLWECSTTSCPITATTRSLSMW